VYIVHRRGTVCAVSLLLKTRTPKNDFTRTVQRLTVYEGMLEVVILKQLRKRKQRWNLPSPSLGHIFTLKGSKKSLVNKNQGWEPIHQKYKANENTSRHNPKKKQKQTMNKKSCKDLTRRRLMK